MNLREWFQGLSSRERYLVLGAVLMAVLVVARYASLSDPEAEEFGVEEDRWVRVQKIESYRRIVPRTDSAKATADKLRERLKAQQNRLIEGTTPTQVGAELQGWLSGLAAEAQLNVLSSQILREDEYLGLRRVGVRLTLSGELDGVTKLLAGIEGATNDVVVSHFEVNRKLGSARRTPTRSTATASAQSQAPLTVSMEVKTLMRPAEGAS
jgi:type II secretory pathway component PulM